MAKSARRRLCRRLLLGAAALVIFCLAWFAIGRLTAPIRAVRLFTPPGTPTAERAFRGRLRIATYNIAHGRGTADSNWTGESREVRLERLRQIAALLKEQNLDVVIVNEVDFDTIWSGDVNQAQFLAREAGFGFVAEQRNLDASIPFVSLRIGNALLSRYPITEATLVDFEGHTAWETVLAGKKRGLLCKVRLGTSRTVRFLATHLEHRGRRTRIASARKIEAVRAADPLPLVVAGDLNSSLANLPAARGDPRGQTALSVLLAGGGFRTLPDATPRAEGLTFSTLKPRSVIDWILVPVNWRIVSRTVIDTKLSDHRPVVMEVQIGGAPASQPG